MENNHEAEHAVDMEENKEEYEDLKNIDEVGILNLIYANECDKLRSIDIKTRNLNFLAEHPETDLDDRISPLAAASFLGRYEIVSLLLENPFLDIDMQTEETGLTALSSACAAGHYMVVKLLVENGADVNKTTSLELSSSSTSKDGFSPLYYCFTRMTETSNLYENKNICCKIAEVLLQAGANIDFKKNDKTLLMKFCGISYEMSKIQESMNLEIIRFLIQHGANKEIKTKKGESLSDIMK